MTDVKTLHQLINSQINTWEFHPAVIFDDGENKVTISYRQMTNLSKKVSVYLSSHALQDEVIGVCIPPNVHTPTLLLGILECGASFYSFESTSICYVRHVIDEVGIRCLVMDKTSIQNFKELISDLDGELILESKVLAEINANLIMLRKLEKKKHNGSLAYCITTSGTTGSPKIVRVPHTCILPNILDLRKIFCVTANDVIFLSSPLTFDPSIVDIFLALSSGACLLIVPHVIKMMPKMLLDMLYKQHNVTIIQATPTLISRLDNSVLPQTLLSDISKLRILALGGEKFPPLNVLQQWRSVNNKTRVFNLYGTTEVSCWSTCLELLPDVFSHFGKEISLGSPLSHTQIVVMDTEGKQVYKGQGELIIESLQRKCYLDNEKPENVDAVVARRTGDIVQILDNGDIVYLYRTDDQVKRNGCRINLSEIKVVTLKLSFITNCEVLYQNGKLAIFVIINEQRCKDLPSDITVTMETHLRNSLPSHYWPDFLQCIKVFPMTRHGKLDKDALWKIILSKKSDMLESEKCVVSILKKEWKEILSVPSDSIESSARFLMCGGDSFSAVRLADQLELTLRITLPLLLDLILHKTFGDICSYIEEELQKTNKNSEILDFETEKELLSEQTIMDTENSNFKSLYDNDESENRTNQSKTPKTYTIVKSVCDTETCNSEKGAIEDIHDNSYQKSHMEDGVLKTFFTTVKNFDNDQFKNNPVQNSDNDSYKTYHLNDDISNQITHFEEDCMLSSALNRKRRKITTNCTKVKIFNSSQDKNKRINGYEQMNLLAEISVSRGNRIQKIYNNDGDELPGKQIAEINDGCYIYTHEKFEYRNIDNNSGDTADKCFDIDVIEAWKYNTGKCVDASPLVVRFRNGLHTVYIGSHSHRFSAITMETGHVQWETMLGDRIESSACLSMSGIYIVVGCYDGVMYSLNNTDGDVWWEFQTEGEVKSSPVLDINTGLVIFGSHDQHVYALNIEDKKCVWKTKLSEGSVFSSPCVGYSPHHVYVCTLSGCVATLNPLTGRILWYYKCSKPVFSSPVVTSEGLCFGCVGGHLLLLDFEGKLKWEFNTDGPIFSSPVLVDTKLMIHNAKVSDRKMVIVGSHDGHVYGLTLHGDLLWKLKCESAVYSTAFCFHLNVNKNQPEFPEPCNYEKKNDISESLSFPKNKNKFDEVLNKKEKILMTYTDNPNKDEEIRISEFENTKNQKHCAYKGRQLYLDNCNISVAASTNGKLYFVDIENGHLLNTYKLPGEVFSSPVVVNNHILIGCRDNFVYCLKINYNIKSVE